MVEPFVVAAAVAGWVWPETSDFTRRAMCYTEKNKISLNEIVSGIKIEFEQTDAFQSIEAYRSCMFAEMILAVETFFHFREEKSMKIS